jgi:uncharacterized membrane protein YhaH (DUF805 family)
MKFFEFIFSDFWIFIGFLILISAVLEFIYKMVKLSVKKSEKKEKEAKKDEKQVL